MIQSEHYEPLMLETIGERLGGILTLKERLGSDPTAWKVREVGDGNLNLVFIVEGTLATVVVKQALPYVRLVGDSWPLPLSRTFFEYEALIRQAKRDPGLVPDIWHFDECQSMLVMEFLTPHITLRNKLIAGEKVVGLASAGGKFCARTAFRGSDLYMETSEKKSDVSLFAKNVELMAITESLVFTDPYFNSKLNHHTPGLDPVVNKLRGDIQMKTAVQEALFAFTANAETLCHGDLHTGSIMCTDMETKIIDPEFGFYGPMGFDLGTLMANYLMAYFSQFAHRSTAELSGYQDWLLGVIEDTWVTFRSEFNRLWHEERQGILFPKSLFEDQGHASELALQTQHKHIWQDALRFCGIEMHRRTLSLAHNADFEMIEDKVVRASLEARNLMMGRDLILNNQEIEDAHTLTQLVRQYNMMDIL